MFCQTRDPGGSDQGGVTLGRPVTETGGDGIININTEDEVRPVLVTDTQYAV